METVFGSTESLLESSMVPVQEVYLGKTKILEQIDREFDIIIRDFRRNSRIDLNKHPSTKKITKLFKEQFGFKENYLSFMPSGSQNAFTIHVGLVAKIKGRSSFKLDKKKGYYDSSHVISSSITIYDRILTNPLVQGKHLTAIVLHEIGHEFDTSPYLLASNILSIIDIVRLKGINMVINLPLYALQQVGVLGKMVADGCRALTENVLVAEMFRVFDFVYNTMLKVYGIADTISNIMQYGFKFFIDSIGNVPKMLISLAQGWTGSSGELHADEVAAMYGYGPELSEGLSFFNFESFDKERGDQINLVTDVANTIISIGTIILTPEAALKEAHPKTQARMKNNINKLKADIKKSDYAPAVKKKLEEDLAKSEEIYNNYVKCCSDSERGKALSYVIRGISDKITGGRNIKSLVPRKHI